jgi:hypothetical protein
VVNHQGKADLWGVISAHRKSLRDASTGSRRLQDSLFFEGVPVAAAGACILANVRLATGTSVGLLTTAGLLSAFLFGLMVQVLDRAATWAESNPEPGPETSWHARYLEELAANAGYASLISVVEAIVLVVASTTRGWPLRAFSGVGVGLGCHLSLTLLMVMKRVFSLTQERLRVARTGAGRRHAA